MKVSHQNNPAQLIGCLDAWLVEVERLQEIKRGA